MRRILPLSIIFLSLAARAQPNQPDTLLFGALDSVTVTATRLESRELDAPLSLTVISAEQIQAGQQQLALNESLSRVLGLLALNADNFEIGRAHV